MSDNNAGTVEVVAIQIARFFAPVQQSLANGGAIDLFAELGLQFPPGLDADASFAAAVTSTVQVLSALPSLAVKLVSAVQSGNFLAALTDLTNGLQQANSGLQSLSTVLGSVGGNQPGMNAGDVATFVQDLPSRLFNWSAVTYVENTVPELALLLDVFGVIERSEQQVGATDPVHPQYTKKLIHLDKLPRAVFSPPGALQDLYGFGSTSFDGRSLFARLQSALSYAGVPSSYDSAASPALLDVIFAQLTPDTSVSPQGLAIAFKVQLTDQDQVIVPPLTVSRTMTLTPVGATLSLRPDLGLSLSAPGSSTASGQLQLQLTMSNPDPPIVVVGQPTGSRLEVHAVSAEATAKLTWDPATATAKGTFQTGASLQGVHLLVEAPSGDGFLTSIFPSNGIDSTFDIGFTLNSSGFHLTGSGSLQLVLPIHLDLGVVQIDGVRLAVSVAASGDVKVPLGADVRGKLGPVSAIVQGIGVEADLKFPGSGGNLGPLDAAVNFLPPNGIGITVDGGPVSGGGFLFVSGTRYAGAMELSVYGVAVKAFGLVDTVLPDGSKGFSFVVVISAEFTPIQLGFGFTLLGVGGLLGINRTVNDDGLSNAVRSGALDNILFPINPVQDAPSLINNLATIFPGALNHYVFGPMAKLGWGTPTLVTGKLGIILELPGPRLAVLGVVQMVLPSSNTALIQINLAVLGILDFPKQLFSLDASLYNSYVAKFSISGDMAFRLTWGDRPNFTLAVGGFNPTFQAPPNFPLLKRVAVDVGLNGNPSLTFQGYFALTSNTAQLGASLDLHASGYGIDIEGYLGFDALFVFSPFSFSADFNAGVSVKFAGVGFGIGLHGMISGPTPWRVQAKVCVSVLFADACLPIDFSFGTNKRLELPPMDPWTGHLDMVDPSNNVIGLMTAIATPTNWSGGFPTGVHPVVTLAAAAASATSPPIDPAGQATLHQKVVPLNLQLTKFGVYQPQPSFHSVFNLSSVTIVQSPPASAQPKWVTVKDLFAPALFTDLSGAAKLSSPSYVPLDSGFTINPNNVTAGDLPSKTITFDTELIDNLGNDVVTPADFPLTQRHLSAMVARSAVARGGIRSAGTRRYVDPTAPVKVTVSDELFVVANACSLITNLTLTPTAVEHTVAQDALSGHVTAQPSDAGVFRVLPLYLRAA